MHAAGSIRAGPADPPDASECDAAFRPDARTPYSTAPPACGLAIGVAHTQSEKKR
jgi:hypothetical protein